MAKKPDENKKKNIEDVLTEMIKDGLEKSGHSAYYLGEEETDSDVTDWISTGSSTLDLAISNRPHGGVPVGRITELSGLEQSGKSLICAHLVANVQKDGGVAVYIDTEYAASNEFFKAIGIKMGKGEWIYAQPATHEEMYEVVEKIVEIIRKNGSNERKILIIIDSLVGAPTKRELEGDYDKDGYATDRAIVNHKAMRKIAPIIAKNKIALVMTNQLRQKMNAPAFSDPWTTSGGKSIPYFSSVQVRLAKINALKNTNKDVIGAEVEATIKKNRVGPPMRKARFNVYFDRGIDDVSSWLEILSEKGIINGKGWYTYVDKEGEEHKFQKSSWSEFAANHPDVVEELYIKMCNSLIMQYQSTDVSTADGTAIKEEDTEE